MMQSKRVIIIDDEAPARFLLNEYLSHFKQLQVACECRDGVEAIEKINSLKPDIIFLDIQLPGKTGFEVLQEIESHPTIIFTTAFDEYALQAFEVCAVDYLLKPYTRSRFEKAIVRVLEDPSNPKENIERFKETMNVQLYPEWYLVESGTKRLSIPAIDILWIEALGDYTRIHTYKSSYLSNNSMQSMTENLNPTQFQRIHRSTIIALSAIKDVKKGLSGMLITLQNDCRVKVSRRYQHVFKNIL